MRVEVDTESGTRTCVFVAGDRLRTRVRGLLLYGTDASASASASRAGRVRPPQGGGTAPCRGHRRRPSACRMPVGRGHPVAPLSGQGPIAVALRRECPFPISWHLKKGHGHWREAFTVVRGGSSRMLVDSRSGVGAGVVVAEVCGDLAVQRGREVLLV